MKLQTVTVEVLGAGGEVLAVVERAGEGAATVQLRRVPLGWEAWLTLSDAVRRAMWSTGMGPGERAQGSTPHGY